MIDTIGKWTDKTIFNNYEDFDTQPGAMINCPNCGNGLKINMNDLKRHQNSHHSNLNKDDNDLVTKIVTDSAPTLTNSFLDYYCPNCNAATRIMYDFWTGGRHGEYGFELKYIVNIKK